jgi:LmbE family N-acetylglucosaminyl deacetylase
MRVIAFFAHPDDETMLAGGTLALLARAGVQVHFVCATRGEGGELGEPPLCTRAELGERREQELVCAVRELGGRSLTFLGYQDPLVGADDTLFPYSDNLVRVAGQLAASVQQFEAQAVITHGSNGEYGHPAHIFTFQAALSVFNAALLQGQALQLYTVAASFPDHPWPRLANQDDPADLVLDVAPVLAHKTAAAMCHQTQHDLFVRRASEEAGRRLTVPEVILPLESLYRVRGPQGAAGSGLLEDILAPYHRPPRNPEDV